MKDLPASLPFAVSQYTTWPLSFEQDLRLYRNLDVASIEVCEGKIDPARPGPALEALQASGLRVASVQPRHHSPFPNSLRPKPAAPGPRMRLLRRTIRLFGPACPEPVLVLNTGLAANGNLDSAGRVAEREFREVSRFAADFGVRLALEPLNPVYMNTDTFVCSLRRAEALIDAVDRPNFGILLDLWHFWEEPDAAARIRGYGGRIFGVHISDWRMPRAFADRLLPGAGEIPALPLLRAIRQAGYVGDYTLEIFSDLKLRDSLWRNPRRTVLRGRDAFARLWRQVRRSSTSPGLSRPA